MPTSKAFWSPIARYLKGVSGNKRMETCRRVTHVKSLHFHIEGNSPFFPASFAVNEEEPAHFKFNLPCPIYSRHLPWRSGPFRVGKGGGGLSWGRDFKMVGGAAISCLRRGATSRFRQGGTFQKRGDGAEELTDITWTGTQRKPWSDLDRYVKSIP